MPLIRYEQWTPRGDTETDIMRAGAICDEYAQDGYDLTLRQLYYQFVARGWIPNTERSYKRLGSIVNKARLAGLIDWHHIVDRTRNLVELPHWSSPANIIQAVAAQYRIDRWDTQPTRVEVWVEKEALAAVVERVATTYDCPWFSCRGYVSQSEMWNAGQRIAGYLRDDKNVVVLHLGDHDPSGIDMTRDIEDRLAQFVAGEGYYSDDVEVRRIALNMDQVQQYDPPPNPTKLSDSRAGGYISEFGYESWELDALDPRTLNELIRDHIEGELDWDAWNDSGQEIEDARNTLQALAGTPWDDVVEFVGGAS